MFSNDLSIKEYDPQLSKAIEDERIRQETHLELIASENHASPRILAAAGTLLTNKYAEGYPGKRYYGGCVHVDEVEELAITRARKLFNSDFVNVQPHSGSQANCAAYLALLKPGDTILGMGLPDGGHLTHGARVSFSGKTYNAVQYGVSSETGLVDYGRVLKLAREHKPKLIIAGFSAYSRFLDWERFREIADDVGAFLVADMAHVAGLVAVDLYPTPINVAHVTTSTTHKTLRGPRSGMILSCAGEEVFKKLDSAVFPGVQGGPLMHIIAAKAVAFKEALEPSFKQYQKQVLKNATVMAETFLRRDYKVVSGGTDNHLFLVDLSGRGLTGKAADRALEQAHITVNKNSVPNDPQSPFVTSGIRVGTPEMTTRGLKEQEAKDVASWMCDVLDKIEDTSTILSVRQRVRELCFDFPVYRT